MRAIYLTPLLALLILASSPLWYIREGMNPQTPEEREAYQYDPFSLEEIGHT